VVVLIVGVLATLITPAILSRLGTAKTNVAKQKVVVIEEASNSSTWTTGATPRRWMSC